MGQSEPGAGSPANAAIVGGLGALGVFGGVTAIGAVAQTAVGDLVTELESFTKFRTRIDEILEDLKKSPANSKTVGEVAISKGQFGNEAWKEATSLYGSYKKVVTELETLSQLLSDSIEGMSIAVLAAHKGYENLDLDIRQRMLAIKGATQEHYDGVYNPVPEETKQGAAQPTSAQSESATESVAGT
ncbi:hypothetical protein [Streptomyces sp. NPDC014734]|uniref:hypothetical protein n=1 Tax=Streptomyces sp. NPDC014734 TaxID=3364886 RepID=UPI0036F87488